MLTSILVAATASCDCDRDARRWITPPAAPPPRCIYVDLGLNDGGTLHAWYNNTGMGTLPRSSIGQSLKSLQRLRKEVYPLLTERGFKPGDCLAIGVEMLEAWSSTLRKQQQALFAEGWARERPVLFLGRAVSTCDGLGLEHTLGTFGDGEVASAARVSQQILPVSKYAKAVAARMPNLTMDDSGRAHGRVVSLNVLRLLHESVRRSDFVVVKMDIEATEYDVVPCLANSEQASLVDVLLLERHPKMTTRKAVEALARATAALRVKGTLVDEGWI